MASCEQSIAQVVDHWETVVYNDDEWSYKVYNQEPPKAWNTLGFNTSDWSRGEGSIGYGDNDDNTIIDPTISLYMRKNFTIADTSDIARFLLDADYDDGFVAYVNGKEVTRSNIGVVGDTPRFDQKADVWREALLYQNGKPKSFELNTNFTKALVNQGNNVLAVQVHNERATSSDLSSHFFLSLGIKSTIRNYRKVPDWFEELLKSSNLPLVIINTLDGIGIQDEPKIIAHMGIINNTSSRNSITDNYNDYDGQIAIEIRGASSQTFPKKNFGFETQDSLGENNNVSLLGMPSENDWILHGPYSDKSLLRNILSYHMGRSIGRYAPRTRWCELYINDIYEGLYVLTERIKRDKNRVDIANLKTEDIEGDELTGGYILQIDRDDASNPDDGWYSKYPDYKFYAFNEPDWEDIQLEQADYIKNYMDSFERVMDGSDYITKYRNFINVDTWIDYFLISEIGKHIDAYKLSFYMHKRKESNGGKLHFGPMWDFNLGYGNFDFDCSPDPEGWSYLFGQDCSKWLPFWIKKLPEIPAVSHKTNCRWQELREGPLHTDSLLQFIDENTALTEEARVRNFRRWDILGKYIWPNDFVADDYDEEIDFLKTWLVERLAWMDANMLGDCKLANLKDSEKGLLNFNIYPNPASSSIRVNAVPLVPMAHFQLFDLLGNRVLEIEIQDANQEILLPDLASGVYVYVLKEDDQIKKRGKIQILD